CLYQECLALLDVKVCGVPLGASRRRRVGDSWTERPRDTAEPDGQAEPDEPDRRAPPAAPVESPAAPLPAAQAAAAAARRDKPAQPPGATPPAETRAVPVEPTSLPSEQLSWVYRRGADVWIYRREGTASLEGTATQVARLLDEIRAVPLAGDKAD